MNFIKRIVCPACDCKTNKEIYSISYNDSILTKYLNDFYNPQGGIEFEYIKNASYTLRECENCKLIYQEYVPNEFLMNKLYEEWLDPKMAMIESNEQSLTYFQKYAVELINIISYFDTIPNNLVFMDFGMGWGKWSLLAKAFGCDSYGMELSKERVDHAKKNGIKILDWEDIPKMNFDFINTEQVFEHIPNPLDTLKYLVQSLKPGGIIKISVPDGNNANRILDIMDWTIPKGTKNSLNIVAPLEHINCYKTESLLALANKSDLEYVDVPFDNYIKKFTEKKNPTYKEVTKNLLRPIYHKLIRRKKNLHKPDGTYLFFRKLEK